MKSKSVKLLVVATLGMLCAVGCATTKAVTIYSDPPGAKISIDGKEKGAAPVEARLVFSSDGDMHTVSAEMEGYRSGTLDIYNDPERDKYTIVLNKKDTVTVLLHELGPAKQTIGSQIVLVKTETTAYLDDSEPSTNSGEIINITRYGDDGPDIGVLAVSPRKDAEGYFYLVYDVTRKDAKSGMLASNLLRLYAGASAKEDHLTRDNERNFGPAVTPDGEKILFASRKFSSRFRLWSMSTNGETGPMIYTDPEGDVFWPDVSPNGQKVAFTAFTSNTDNPRVWTVEIKGTLARALDEGTQPRFSPAGGDEPDIVYVKTRENSKRRKLWRMSHTGRDIRPVTDAIPDTVDVKDPGWSPDGKWLVFASNEGADRNNVRNWDIWIMRADGQFRTRLTENGSWDDAPVWGKDGYIYFRSNRGGHWNIWRLKPLLDRIGNP